MSDVRPQAPQPEIRTDATEAAQRLAAIVESSNDAILSKDLNGVIQSWNAGAERIFGYTAEEAIGKPITIVIPPEMHDQEPAILARIANGEMIDRYETIRQRKDGSQFHISLTISPIRDRTGKIVGASKIGQDITGLRQGQERQELLLREMNHRVKNLFAVASGVVALSARSTTTSKELATAVQSRLAALSRAHELILPRHEGDANRRVPLEDLVKLVLAPYDHGEEHISIAGPPIECGSSASTSLALLMHEFATNSVKYGALAHPTGRVVVSWQAAGDILPLTWNEETHTHTRTQPPATPGFGSQLVEATARSMGAEISRSWSEGGLSITIKIPLAKLSL